MQKQGAGEDEASVLQGVGSHLVQLTPEVVKDLTPEQIYKIYQVWWILRLTRYVIPPRC